MHSSLFLSGLLLLPALGAVVALLVRKQEGRSYVVAVATAFLELVLSVVVAFTYNAHVANAQGFDFAYSHVLSPVLGIAYSVAADGISVWMVVLSALTVLIALLAARDRRRESA